MKITQYGKVTSIDGSDVFLVDGVKGTRILPAEDFIYGLCDSGIPLGIRRMIFRGKNLGSKLTEDQKTEIKAGTFKGLFLGDYWENDSKIWRIVDFDYWYNIGDTVCKTHHVVVMPDRTLYTANMNDADTTDGGYLSSKMRTENLNTAKTLIINTFGESYILNHRVCLTNAVVNGHASNVAWVDSTIELPNEFMLFGADILSPRGDGTFINYEDITSDRTQLALMAIDPYYINPSRQTIWLRNIATMNNFLLVFQNGNTATQKASSTYGVRPVFGITGGN